MAGETNLEKLLATMRPELQPGVYVFATVDHDFDTAGLSPRMIFQESEGKTLILMQETAEQSAIDFEFPCRMITLNVHSSLDAIGFLAAITAKLAALGMGVNPVSGFFHDHLFVPVDRADDAMRALETFAKL